MLPLTQAEIGGSTADPLVHRLLDGAELPADIAASTTTREEYARRITSGGMPVALRRPPGRSRSRWFANYLERDDGTVIAFEIKAGTRVDRSDLAGIGALRTRIGDRLASAVVLYTGPLAYTHADGTLVLPLDILWTR